MQYIILIKSQINIKIYIYVGWFGLDRSEKSIQNQIRSSDFHKKNIQTHLKIFGFFSVFLDRFAV
jgi:hypothetical protein